MQVDVGIFDGLGQLYRIIKVFRLVSYVVKDRATLLCTSSNCDLYSLVPSPKLRRSLRRLQSSPIATNAKSENQERHCVAHDKQDVFFEFAVRTVDVPRMVSIHSAYHLDFAGPSASDNI